MKKLFIITGEASGDIHAAKVAEYIKNQNADIQIEAIGGNELRNLGINETVTCDVHNKAIENAIPLKAFEPIFLSFEDLIIIFFRLLHL